MTKAEIAKLEKLASDFLQYRYAMYLYNKELRSEDPTYDMYSDDNYTYYQGACDMIDAIGGQWRRNYFGKGSEDIDNIHKYSHTVWFPNKQKIEWLNAERWCL